MSVLRVDSLSVRFGAVRAVSEVSLEVGAGALVGLIGPNGAGKTTCIDAITGFVRAEGTISVNGSDISGLAPHARVRHGLGRTWQSLELFDDLTVEENLQAAADRHTVVGLLLDVVAPRRRRDRSSVDHALDVLGLRHLAGRLPNEISQGQRKLVATARALAARPSVICMDEPAAGLDTNESALLGERLRGIVDDGTGILLVDHDMDLVMSVCDYIYVIDFGVIIAQGSAEEIARSPEVIAAYLGTQPEAPGHGP